MPKRDLQQRINDRPAVAKGILTGATVVQVSQLAMSAPFSGDFQIIDQGRLIVGANIDFGPRVVVTDYGLFGYDTDGVNTFAAVTRPWTTYGAGDVFAGYVSGNYLLFDQSEGTLGVYSPAGAGFIADSDGSLYAGDTDGAHMRWNTANRALEIRNGEDVKISLDANGDGFFDGTVYAAAGRIYGPMQVDGLLRVGDVDGPNVSMGRFERYDDSGLLVESGEIVATDANNMPWFRVVAGGGTTYGGHFHLGATGDYAGRMTFDGQTLRVAEWTVNSQALVSPDGNTKLDTREGIVFRVVDETEGGTLEDVGGITAGDEQYFRAVSFIEDGRTLPLHRIYAARRTVAEGVESNAIIVQSQVVDNDANAEAWFGSIGDREGRTVVRAIGAYGDEVNQQVTTLTLWAYRGGSSGTPFSYRRMDFDTDAVVLQQTEIASYSGTIPSGTLINTDGTFDPGVGAGVYAYQGGAWKPVVLDADAVERKTADFTADGTATYFIDSTSGDVTCTLPSAADVPLGWTYTFKRQNVAGSPATTIYIDPGTDAIDGSTTDRQLTAQNQYLVIRKRNVQNWIIIGAN